MRLLRRYRDNETGLAAIEGALAFPFLLFIGFGIIDTSLLMMQYHRLSTGLTSASNYLAKTPNPQSLESNAKQLAVSGKFQSSAEPFIEGVGPNAVSITYRDFVNPEMNGTRDYRGGDTIKIVEISASIPYKGIGFLKTITAGNLKLSAHHEARLIGLTT